jgi:hypothetical protein
MSGKGMQLGKKSAQASLFETIKQEEGVRELSPQRNPAPVPVTTSPSVPVAHQVAAINEEG